MYTISDLGTQIVNGINNIKTSLASAISSKGVTTASNESFTQMVANINSINASGTKLNVNKLTPPSPMWQASIIGYSSYVDTDSYLISSYSALTKVNPNTGTTIWTKSLTHNNPYFIYKDTDTNYITGTYSGYLSKIKNDGTSIVWDVNLAQGDVYCMFKDTDGYVCGTKLGYLIKIKPDGSGILWSYNVGKGYIYTIIKDLDGSYVIGTSSGWICKINNSGTATTWSYSSGGSINYIVQESDGYICFNMSAGNYIKKVNNTGTGLVWTYNTEYVNAAQVIKESDGYVIFNVVSNNVSLLKLSSNGTKVWKTSITTDAVTYGALVKDTYTNSYVCIFNTGIASLSYSGVINYIYFYLKITTLVNDNYNLNNATNNIYVDNTGYIIYNSTATYKFNNNPQYTWI